MYLQTYRVKNFRRLCDVQIDLAEDISVFVGANNSGKTSATQAIQMFLSARKDRFSLFDFSSHAWRELNALGEADAAGDQTASIPAISIDLWFAVKSIDLHLVLNILPTSAHAVDVAGIRIEFAPKNGQELMRKFRAARHEAQQQSAALGKRIGAYVPWPKNLTDYLERELQSEYEFRYFVLDRAKFDEHFQEQPDYKPAPLVAETGGATLLKTLVRVDSLSAQRHLADPASGIGAGGGGRAEDLSKRLSRFYKRNLAQRAADHAALKALFDSEAGLNDHLMNVFKDTLDRIATLGYPGLYNPRLEIKSGLNPTNVMSQDARVHYILGDSDGGLRLPDTYNGLGFKNLIYMVVEILDVHAAWKADESRPPLHLIFIEEPEAHLHAQMQQVFVRNVLALLDEPDEKDSVFCSQAVITTHSPHLLYERGFSPIRYFRREVAVGDQTTRVLNLSSFQKGENPKDRDFLQRYLKLTHCDLFFADAVILVEGNVERLLLPLMIEKEAKRLASVALSILEVGGAFGHRFKELIEFLGITTLVITDIDSVTEIDEPQEEDPDDGAPKEFELPGEGEGAPPVQRFGRTCLPAADSMTANQTLIQWLPKKRTLADLWAAPVADKQQDIPGCEKGKVRVTYQGPVQVRWNGTQGEHCGRTLEEAFGLENAAWSQAPEQKSVGLKLRTAPADTAALALGLHKRVTGKNFDKTKFALGVLTRRDGDWKVPTYIKDGLVWLQERVDLEVTEEVEAAAGALAEAAVAEADLGEAIQ
ncbi:ATP-dependent endonuclease [Labrys sp. La1]|uniref:ATP-dependent nuclease n=1 Tax=Labrys sp. La1 TaxID=3404917 RepID=UPI003EBC1DAE